MSLLFHLINIFNLIIFIYFYVLGHNRTDAIQVWLIFYFLTHHHITKLILIFIQYLRERVNTENHIHFWFQLLLFWFDPIWLILVDFRHESLIHDHLHLRFTYCKSVWSRFYYFNHVIAQVVSIISWSSRKSKADECSGI